jgi:TrpR family trp operon transcriptional repressor
MNNDYRDELLEALLQLKSKEEMESFLRGILTPQELEELPKRLTIFKMLKAGITQHEIAKKLGVGVATVTRGSHELQRGQIQKTGWWRDLSSLDPEENRRVGG